MKLLPALLVSALALGQFEFARLDYGDRPGAMYPGQGRGWYTDFDDGSGSSLEAHLMPLIRRATRVDVGEPVVAIPHDLKNYPFLYTVEPEQMDLTYEERLSIREWLRRGGFWMLDDFHGCDEMARVMFTLTLIFMDVANAEDESEPLPEFKTLTTDHPLFHTVFDLDEIVQVPVVWLGEMHYMNPGWPTNESQTACRDPQVLLWDGYPNDGSILLAFNTDLGDGMEHADVKTYPEKFSAYSYKFFINTITYALTH